MTNNQELPPNKIALIIDNKVVDVLHTDERFAAILLSSPTIIDVTDFISNIEGSIINWNYDGEKFIAPQPEGE